LRVTRIKSASEHVKRVYARRKLHVTSQLVQDEHQVLEGQLVHCRSNTGTYSGGCSSNPQRGG
jgi:hypothetical protein